MTIETFAAATRGSHQARCRLTTYDTAGGVRTVYGPKGITLDGSVSYDREREVRRAAGVRIVDRYGTLAPTAVEDELANGARIRLERGVSIGGALVWWDLGLYEVIESVSDLDGSIALRAEDPTTACRRDMGEVYTVGTGTRARQAIRDLWERTLGPSVTWDLDDASMVLATSRTFTYEEERLHAALDLMADLSLEVYAARDGTITMRPYVDPVALPVAKTLRQADGIATATSMSRGTDWRPVNYQVVVGEPTDGAVVRGTARITNTGHPHHENHIGRRAGPTYRSAQVATVHQATSLAQRLLTDRARWRDRIEWQGLPDVTLDAGDVVAVVEQRTRTDSLYRIDRITHPVALGTSSFTASRVVPIFAPEA